MMALLVALLTTSSAVAALWPLVTPVATRQLVVEDWSQGAPPAVKRRQGCRRINIVVRPKPGEVQQGCSSVRKRPCAKRRHW
jgi:hypothetical protein